MKNTVTKPKLTLYSLARNLWNGMLSFPYPLVCINCKNELINDDDFLCLECYSNLKFTHFENQLNTSLAHETFFGRVDLNFVSSLLLFERNSITQNILHKMKYQNAENLCFSMGVLMGEKIKNLKIEFDYIIPVPLHDKKKFKRGYNQSELLGNGISSVLNIPQITDVFLKVRDTKTQTKKSRENRVDNVQATFLLKNSKVLEGKHILVIDDVLTTGATLEACANVLNKIPDISLSIYTLAYSK